MTAKEKGKNFIDRALGEVVTPIVDCLDVDGVVRRIDVNDAVQRIDIDALVQKIDINALLQKVDINALIQRSDLEMSVAQSSSGVFTGIMDTLRFQIVRVDLFLLQVFQCGKQVLPPAPGMVDTKRLFPETTTQKAVTVQLHYCGIFSKALAFAIDIALLFLVQTFFTIAVATALKRVNQLFLHWESDSNAVNQDEFLATTALNMISTCCYFWIAIALTGQTIGMAIVGVRVVNSNGDKDISLSRAAIRTGSEVFTILAWPLAILVGLYRRDGRMPHDILARTGVIFKWNARMARLREQNIIEEDGSSQSSMNVQQGSDVDTASDDGSSNRGPCDTSEDSDNDVREDADDGNKPLRVGDPSNLNATSGEAEGHSTTGGTNVDIESECSTSRSVPPTTGTRRESTLQRKSSDFNKAKESFKSIPKTIVLSLEATDGGSTNAGASFSGTRISPNNESEVRQALEQGRAHLQCVHATGITGLFFNPFRSLVLDPSLAVASAVVPPVVSVVPFVDGVAANIVRLPFAVARIGCNLVPFCEFIPQVPNLTDVAQNDISCTLDISKAVSQLNLVDSLRCVKNLSQSLGITASDMLDDPLRDEYNGRLSDDLKILQRIQEDMRNDRWRETSRFQHMEIQNDINEGSRMIQFAIAAYGTGTLDELQDIDSNIQDICGMKRRIAQHVGIDQDDVKLLCLSEPGGNRMLLRHFVAVDRISKSIILSIRGTLSQYGNRSDMKCGTTDFCMGIAHKDLSDIADNIWSVSGTVVENLFMQLENENENSWRFVLTGHFLGAGAAALLNIKCHVEGLLANRQVKCFAFASPPVYNLLNRNEDLATPNPVKDALGNATAFVCGDDFIPFLSQGAVCGLATQIRTIDDACKRLWHRDRSALASGRTPIPEILAQQVSRQADIATYFRLEIPAGNVVWLRNDQSSCRFNAVGYAPSDLAKHDIYISAHISMPALYEKSLKFLAT
jgi:uncharacterized RDD family membrane protein YckC